MIQWQVDADIADGSILIVGTMSFIATGKVSSFGEVEAEKDRLERQFPDCLRKEADRLEKEGATNEPTCT